MVKLLHDNGAALTFTTASKGRTALHLAAMSGNVQVARLLENDYPSPDVQVQLMRQLVLHMRQHVLLLPQSPPQRCFCWS